MSHVHSPQGNSGRRRRKDASSRIELLIRRGKTRGSVGNLSCSWSLGASSWYSSQSRQCWSSVVYWSAIRAQISAREGKLFLSLRFPFRHSTRASHLQSPLVCQFWSSNRMFSPESQGSSGSSSNQGAYCNCAFELAQIIPHSLLVNVAFTRAGKSMLYSFRGLSHRSVARKSMQNDENFYSLASPSIYCLNAATDVCGQVFSGYFSAQDGLNSRVGLEWSVGTYGYENSRASKIHAILLAM